MDDMGLDDAVEHVTPNESEITVNRGQSTLHESPGLSFVMR